MIAQSKIKLIVTRCSRSFTHIPNTVPEESSLVQWLTSPTDQNATAPPVNQRIQFTAKSSVITASYPNHSQILTQDQSLCAAAKFLSARRLLRSPVWIPPLLVEYSSPNIAKPLHMGHLRSTLTGSYVYNIASYAGHDCVSTCFLGDWGRQFGILHAGVLQKMKFQNVSNFQSFVESLSLHQLLQIYIDSSTLAKSNPDFLKESLHLSSLLENTFSLPSDGKFLWNYTKNVTISHLKSCYDSLGITFDYFEGESTYNRDSPYTSHALQVLAEATLSRKHLDGSLRVQTGDTESILLKRDDSSVYLLRDIACALDRLARHKTHFVYVVDEGQANHFKNLFEILEKLNVSKKCSDNLPFSDTHVYIPFGKVSGMSTRAGNFVLLSDVISQGTDLMHKARRESRNARNIDDVSISEKLAVSGLIINALKVRRSKSYTFDWNEALRSRGNSGVSLQYTVARLTSLVDRITGGNHVEIDDIQRKLQEIFKVDELLDLTVCLMNFEDIFWRSYTTVEPCVLVSYSFNLADKVSKALSTVNILKSSDPTQAQAALWVFYKSKLCLENCMKILGVPIVTGF